MKRTPELQCAVWEFTRACNLRCLHCGASAGRKRDDELTTAEAERLCQDLRRAGCLGIALMGGEPLLRHDFFPIAGLIRELGMELSIITNGTILSEELIPQLHALQPRAIAVSLDASTASLHDHIRGQEGAYQKTWKFLRNVLEAGLPASVITTVHKLNLGELAGLREQLLGKNIAWQIQAAGAEGQRFPAELLLDEEEFYSVGLFISSTRKKYSTAEMPVIGAHDMGYHSLFMGNLSLAPDWLGCQAGKTVVGIQSNGNIKGCLAMDDSMIEGNVRQISLGDLWHHPDSFRYTRRFIPADAGENCRNCRHVETCRGGCNEMSLMKTGQLHNDPYCFYRIEQRLFARELRNPLTRLLLRVRGKLHSRQTAQKARGLAKIFLGYR